MTPYDFRAIEARWQAHGDAHETFRTRNPGDPRFDPDAPPVAFAPCRGSRD